MTERPLLTRLAERHETVRAVPDTATLLRTLVKLREAMRQLDAQQTAAR